MLFAGIITIIINDPDSGSSLWFPVDTLWYRLGVSPLGLFYLVIGIVGCCDWVTCLAGALYLTCAAIYMHAAYRQEAGDGGYFERKDAIAVKLAAAEKLLKEQKDNPNKAAPAQDTNDYVLTTYVDLIRNMTFATALSNTYEFLYKAYNEDKISTYTWVTVYLLANVYYYFSTVSIWYGTVNRQRMGLLDGTLDLNCELTSCIDNRVAIQYGPSK